MIEKIEKVIGGKRLIIESGELAKQANGAVLVTYGETTVLCTAVADKDAKEGLDFFPLTVEYREKTYAAGKIPGGFFKREGRPSEKEILTSRLIDRPLRPSFQDGFKNETQVICTVLSADQENDPDILAMVGASSALIISDLPFLNPIGAVRVGRINGQFVLNPTYQELEASDLNIILSATSDAIVMVEGGAKELSEEVILNALMFGFHAIKDIIEMQYDLRKRLGLEKISAQPAATDNSSKEKVRSIAHSELKKAYKIAGKAERYAFISELLKKTIEATTSGIADEAEKGKKQHEVKAIFESLQSDVLRTMVLDEKVRLGNRSLTEIREISGRVGVLLRTHGSSIFTRGETQALVAVTLGTSTDEQMLDNLEGKTKKSFMLHYNFPPFSVGEVGPMRGPGRREIGHGALAERAVFPILPLSEKFPYTIRIVSDILESNGSSSMASVCGSSLSLMDAGVPIVSPVAGIAMGLIKEGDKIAILSDITGDEDHLGDMDFKVAGTVNGITALQMDIKINGITEAIFKDALMQAKEGRLKILNKMAEIMPSTRSELSKYAPRILTIKINVDKIRDVIGSGGKTIRGIIEKTGANIDVDDNGLISISSVNEKAAQDALMIIKGITDDVEIGKIYLGKVKKIMNFGAFVEILPGKDGLVHISEIAKHRVANVEDELSEGEEIKVKVLDVDREGKVRLSRKEAMLDE